MRARCRLRLDQCLGSEPASLLAPPCEVCQHSVPRALPANDEYQSASNFEEVTIDPGAYAGALSIVGVDDNSAYGARAIRAAVRVVGTGLYADDGYSVRIAHGNGFRFDLDCNGALGLSDFHVGAATTAGSRLTFCTVDIEITPLNYDRAWGITGAERALANGARVVRLIRHVENYILQLDRTTLSGKFSLTKTGEPEREFVEILGEGEVLRFQMRLVPNI